jgi:degradative hydroxymethylglutaryl-CoA reductase
MPKLNDKILKTGGLSMERADFMIENCVGVMSLPLGLGTGFKINGENYIIPMAVEEPSVITACSVIGKLISKAGGFSGSSTKPIMIAQIQILDLSDLTKCFYKLKNAKKELIAFANTHCENMV